MKPLLLTFALLGAFSPAVRADIDPDIAIDVGTNSTALQSGVNNFTLNNGGGIFGFYNPLSTFITQLQFDVNVLPGLGTTPFHCQSNNFFLNCSAIYDNSTGALSMTFSGVNPDPDPVPDPTDPETGEFVGIPPLMPGCAAHPDSGLSDLGLDCTSVGHFLISLNNDFSFADGFGGSWNLVLPQGQNSTLSLNTTINGVPEPSTALLLGGVLLGLTLTGRRLRGDKLKSE